MSMQLQEAIDSKVTFADLIPIAKQLKAKISFWGRQYMIIDPNNGEEPLPYIGEAPIGSLVDRTQTIIQTRGYTRLTYPEKKEADILDAQIDRIYLEDKKNLEAKNIIIRIFVFLKEIFFRIFIQDYNNHQFFWNGDDGCQSALDRHILLSPLPQWGSN